MQRGCVNCSQPLATDATFCESCGAQAHTTVACPNCGKSSGAGAKFCKHCAFNLAADPAAAATGSGQADTPAASPFRVLAQPQRAVPVNSAPQLGTGVALGVHSQPGLTPAAGWPTSAEPPARPDAAPPDAAADKRSFITPAGAAMVIICFFLPWVQFSCGPYTQSVTGLDVASRGDSTLWLVLFAAVAALGAYFFFKAQHRVAKSKPFVIICSLVGLAVMLYKSIEFSSGQQTVFGRITPRDLGLSPQVGALGTFLGYLLTLAGAATLRRYAPRAQAQPAPAAARAPLRANVVGALCYAAVPALLVLWVLGVPLLAIPLSYLLLVAAPLVFLFAGPHKANPAVRIHALQSALLSAAFSSVAFVRVLLVPGLSLEEYAPALTVSDGLWQLLFLALLGVMFFLMYSAYQSRAVSVPALSDFAAKLAGRGQRGPSGM